MQGASWRLTKPNGLRLRRPDQPGRQGWRTGSSRETGSALDRSEVICLPDGCGREADSNTRHRSEMRLRPSGSRGLGEEGAKSQQRPGQVSAGGPKLEGGAGREKEQEAREVHPWD